jgi:uncharacterized protein (DUF2141 family)
MKRRNWLGHAAVAVGLALPACAWCADLELKVENVKEPVGDLKVGVYGSADDFRKTAVREVRAPASANPVVIRIPGLAAGDYAIAIYHDRNGNQKLDSNLLGIPKEPYGFSGSGRNLTGPATWEQARFSLPAAGGALTILLSD